MGGVSGGCVGPPCYIMLTDPREQVTLEAVLVQRVSPGGMTAHWSDLYLLLGGDNLHGQRRHARQHGSDVTVCQSGVDH